MLYVVYFEGFFNRFKGGFEKHCTRASLHSHTVEDLIRIRGQVWKMLMLERVWSAGLFEAKDQEIKAKLQELAIRGACDCNGG